MPQSRSRLPLLFRAVEDMLKASKGSLINIASVNGTAVFGHPAYSGRKSRAAAFYAAGRGRIRKVRHSRQWGRAGHGANAGLGRPARRPIPMSSKRARRWYPLPSGSSIPPTSPMPSPFLAGPLAAAITGVCLPVDCGLTAGQAELAHTFSQSDHY